MLQPLPLYFPLQFSASSEFLALGGRDCWENLGNNCIRLAAVPFHTLPTLPPKSFRRVGARGRGTFFKRFPSPAEAASSESLALGGEGPFAKGPLPQTPSPQNLRGKDRLEMQGNNRIRLAAVPFHTLPTLPPKSFRRVGARGRGTFFKRFPSPEKPSPAKILAEPMFFRKALPRPPSQRHSNP